MTVSEMTKGTFGSPFFKLVNRQIFAESARFPDAITLQALRADPDPARGAIDQDAHGLEVGIPAPLGSIIGVADVIAGNRPLGAHGAHPCHKFHPHLRVVIQRARKLNEPSPVTQHTGVHHSA
jgi:hypothetical protein